MNNYVIHPTFSFARKIHNSNYYPYEKSLETGHGTPMPLIDCSVISKPRPLVSLASVYPSCLLFYTSAKYLIRTPVRSLYQPWALKTHTTAAYAVALFCISSLRLSCLLLQHTHGVCCSLTASYIGINDYQMKQYDVC